MPRSVAAFALALAIAAIPAASSRADDSNVCALLTADDVSSALGETIKAGLATQDGCFWRGSGTDGVTVEAPGTGQPGFANAQGRMSPITQLSGVGDAAFEFVSLAGFVEVAFVKGDTFMTVVVQNSDQAAARSAAAQLAATIARRL